MKKLSVVDIFAGAGGLSYGFLETDKFEIKLAVELDKNAQLTYMSNHKNPAGEIEILSDITKISNEDYKSVINKYGEIDVVIGGPPCQGFSNANRQKKNLISGNNQLVTEYIRAIEQLDPKAFVMENVKMIRSNKHKFYYNHKNKNHINSLGVTVTIEVIEISKLGLFSQDDLQILNYTNNFKKFIIEDKYYKQLVNLYRNKKDKEKFDSYINKNQLDLMKLIDTLKKMTISFWNTKHKNAFYKFLNALEEYIIEKTRHIDLINFLEAIIESQKTFNKFNEIRENLIEIRRIFIDKEILCVELRSFRIIEYVLKKLRSMGYEFKEGIINAADYGVPQNRERYIIMGIKKEYIISEKIEFPSAIIKDENKYYTIGEAIKDLAKYEASTETNSPAIKKVKCTDKTNKLNEYLNDNNYIYNHIVTKTREKALSRYKILKPGQNFHDLDDSLKSTYSNPKRTQNSIYLRLNYTSQANTVTNVRKSMWIHPEINRAISIREAARLQSFKDSFVFYGTKDSQYQQIGNAVPPLMGMALAEKLLEIMGYKTKNSLTNLLCR